MEIILWLKRWLGSSSSLGVVRSDSQAGRIRDAILEEVAELDSKIEDIKHFIDRLYVCLDVEKEKREALLKCALNADREVMNAVKARMETQRAIDLETARTIQRSRHKDITRS